MDLSVIIINHNTKELIKTAVSSVLKNTNDISFEIIIIDNSSKNQERIENNYAEKLPINLIYTKNKGFGNACNIGAKSSKGDFLLFLNSDTMLQDNTLCKCVEYMKNSKNLGVLGAKTILSNGEFDHGCKRGFPTPMSALYYFIGLDKKFPNSKKFGTYHQTFIDKNKTSEVDAVSGSCMFIPKDVFLNVNGFDEDFFMYGEDLDICYRIKQAGFKVIYFADTYVLHLKGQSGLNSKSKETIFNFYDSMKIFYNKHYKNKYNKLVTAMVMFAINFKCKMNLNKIK